MSDAIGRYTILSYPRRRRVCWLRCHRVGFVAIVSFHSVTRVVGVGIEVEVVVRVLFGIWCSISGVLWIGGYGGWMSLVWKVASDGYGGWMSLVNSMAMEGKGEEGWLYDGREDSVERAWMERGREGVRLIRLLSRDEIGVGSFLGFLWVVVRSVFFD